MMATELLCPQSFRSLYVLMIKGLYEPVLFHFVEHTMYVYKKGVRIIFEASFRAREADQKTSPFMHINFLSI